MNDCDALLQTVMAQASALGIPFSPHTVPRVTINRRAATRFGCCRLREGEYTLEVALRVAQGPELACRETLAHELLHTCWGCLSHGKRWKAYARKMNEAYGYHVSRTTSSEALGVGEAGQAKYILRCTRCGTEFRRLRASRLTRCPEGYRCKCGGALERVK